MAFKQRCSWRGININLFEVNLGEQINFKEMDFLFLGGGSDREQNLIAADLTQRTRDLKEAIEDGLVVLAICGGYQLLGKYYRTLDGKIISGLELLDFYTEAGLKRFTGNIVIEVILEDNIIQVVGFENHAGRTFLGQIYPLGRVLSGYGNNGKDNKEGVRYKNVFCSYLHGPLLPKNPMLADYLIATALKRRGQSYKLDFLNDSLELAAQKSMLKRLLK
jgi:hypothetical protein